MDPVMGLGTGHFSQLLASALEAGDGTGPGEQTHVSHSPTPSHTANEADALGQQSTSLERMKTAVQTHLSAQLTSDFVEGLRPVMSDGQLKISTYIPLQGEEEPVFIGNFPSIQAAVQAQRQSHALVGRLPGPIARKLIQAQLANALSALPSAAVEVTHPAEPAADITPASDKGHATQPDTSAPSAQAPADAAAATAAAAGLPTAENAAHTEQQQQQQAQEQQQQASAGATAERQPVPGVSADAAAPVAVEQATATAAAPATAAGTTDSAGAAEVATTAADGATEQGAGDNAAAAPAAPEAALGAQPPPAAPVAANPADNAAPTAAAAAPAASAAPAAGAAAAQPLSALTDDVINLLLRKGLNALSAVAGQSKETDSGGDHQQQQQQGEAATAGQPADHDASQAPVTAGVDINAFGQGQFLGLTAEQLQQYQQQMQAYPAVFGQDMPGGLPSSSAPAAAAGGALDGALEAVAPHTGQYRASGQGHLPPRPALHGPWGGAGTTPADGAVAAAAGLAGFAAFPAGTFPAAAFSQDAFALAQAGADMYGRRPRSSTDTGFGAWDYSTGMFAGAAPAQPTNSGDMKRKRSDPRLNCIKSVQYRVSRFPAELHDMCMEHWERTRCARVVCNGVNGVMSVQGGRCVVSFTQHGQEVLKGVADYLRYAGEDRIKKWRRHVRMVDFPRPNNRTGELMTAEEFLCIVGYQSEQGGGKRPKYMSGAAGMADTAGDGSE